MVESCYYHICGNYVGVVSLKEVGSNIFVHTSHAIVYLNTTLLEILDPPLIDIGDWYYVCTRCTYTCI